MTRIVSRLAIGLIAAGFGIGSASAQAPAGIPDYLAGLTGTTPPAPGVLPTRDVLQLNTSMFALYDAAAKIFQTNIMNRHPLILALFSGAGGRMILYRPGKPPEEAPSVPIVYQVMKSTGHSTMAISEVVMPYIGNAADKSWMAPMLAYRTQMKTALDGVDALPIQEDWKPAVKNILGNNVAYMDDCLAKGVITMEALQASLGPDFDKAYAAANTIYVARQNNVLFSVLAQYFGPEAINDRLMLIETISFTTTPQEMLTSMVRIISDRSVGALFFGNDRLMDFELMGGDGRKTIISEMQKRGKQAFLPPAVPFGSKQWPALVTPGPGATSLDDLK